jgi:hypothetical protein
MCMCMCSCTGFEPRASCLTLSDMHSILANFYFVLLRETPFLLYLVGISFYKEFRGYFYS